MRRFGCLVVLAVVLAPAAASADVFKLYGELGGGGAYGTGLSGTYKDATFFGKASPGGVGSLLVGGRFLIFDGNIRHNQFFNGGETETWTQFTAGLAFGMDTGSEEEKKQHKGGYFEMGAGVAFGVGTGAQVDPPLDNSEITDKGFLLEGRIGFGWHLSSVFDFGLTAPVSWGYFFKTGGGANDPNNQYQGIQLQGLAILRANVKLF